jgi:hypothetical protein
MFGWLFGSGDDSVHVREQDLDGTVWHIVDEYGDPWLNAKTRLSKLTFLVREETDHADHVSFRPSDARDSRDLGPVARNLHDICEMYNDYEEMRVRSKTTFGGNKRWRYRTTDDGSVAEQIPDSLRADIDRVVEPYADMPVSNLVQEICEEYPSQSSTHEEW